MHLPQREAPTVNEPIDKRVAFHEAGHAIVADALGLSVVEIIPTEDGWACGVDCPKEPTITEHFIMAAWALAGGVAQDRVGYPPDAGCMTDVNDAARHVHMWLGGDPDDGPPEDKGPIDAGLLRAMALARHILVDRWMDVVDLAAAIEENSGMSVAQMVEFEESR